MNVEIENWYFEGGPFEFTDGHVILLVGEKRLNLPFGRGVSEDGREAEDGIPAWNWDGDEESPTLQPSVKWHGEHFFVEDGEVVPAN